MKKRKLLTFIIAFIFFQNIFSQSDFRNGFIITNKKDTLKGFIDYREGDKNYTSFKFKKSEKLEHTTYNAKQIKAYGFINDKFFESKKIPNSNKTIEYAFFEILVRGKASLYKFKDGFYVEKDDNKMHKLSNEIKGDIYKNGKIYRKKSNRYIGVLQFLFSDCSEIKKKINNLEFTEMNLTKLVEQYNICVGGPSISYKESKPWFKTHIGLVLGANTSKLNFYSDYKKAEYLTKGFDGSNSIMPGLYFDFLSPRIHERIAFHVSVFYLSSKFVSFSSVESISSIYWNDVTIEFDQLKIPMGFKYTFPDKNFTPYFNLGLSYTYLLKTSSLWIQERERNNIVTTFKSEAINLGKSLIGFWGGVGVKRSIVNDLNGFLEIRYERTTGNFTFPSTVGDYMDNSLVNFQLLIGISF